MLRIKYPKFLNCIKYIPKGSDICIIEAIESLAYGNSESKYLSTVLEQNGNDYQKLINIIIEKYDLQVVVKNNKYVANYEEDTKEGKKKKAIKDIMVENYLIRMKVEKGLSISQIKKILFRINLRLFLKMLPLKNILIEDGEIISILDPIIEDLD